MNIWRNIICWNWVWELGILEGWRQILHCEAESGAAALLKPSSLSQRLQNRVSFAPILVSIHATYFFSKSAPSSLLPTLSRLCNTSVHTSPSCPLPARGFQEPAYLLEEAIFLLFSILISLSAICTQSFLVRLVLHRLSWLQPEKHSMYSLPHKGLEPNPSWTSRRSPGQYRAADRRHSAQWLLFYVVTFWLLSPTLGKSHLNQLPSSSLVMVMTTAAHGVHSPAFINTCPGTTSRLDCLRKSQSAKESLQATTSLLAANCSSWFAGAPAGGPSSTLVAPCVL